MSNSTGPQMDRDAMWHAAAARGHSDAQLRRCLRHASTLLASQPDSEDERRLLLSRAYYWVRIALVGLARAMADTDAPRDAPPDAPDAPPDGGGSF